RPSHSCGDPCHREPLHKFTSRHIHWSHASGNLRALLAFDHADIVLALQVEPELRAVAEVTAKAHRRIGRDTATKIKDVCDAARGHPDIQRQLGGAEFAGGHFAFQHAARMYDGSHNVLLIPQSPPPRTPSDRRKTRA